MVSSYTGHPILYAHLIWNHITAAFLRYGTLIHFEDYKDTISNKYTKLMVSSYKPDSKKVGTLYKLWIEKECNNLQIS